MESRAKLFGHPIHQMLIVFPLGLLLYAASGLVRSNVPATPAALAYVVAFAGGGLARVTGWLGGELVGRLAVGVDSGAHLDAPNSLTRRRVA